MTTMPVPHRRYTIEEYLRMEEKAKVRHEFHDGEILAMSGGTYEHSIIILNFNSTLRDRLRGGPCRVAEGNLRVRIASLSKYVYPDGNVICGQPVFDPADENRTTVVNPRVIIEVLSDSTEAYDRGTKFHLYRMIESLEEYVLVSTRSPTVETFMRQADGSWKIEGYFEGLETWAELKSLKVTLPMSEIYDGITFPPPTPESNR